MKAYILKGDPVELDKVLRENRIRISRGVISITPVDTENDKASIEPVTEQTPTPIDNKHIGIEDIKDVAPDADTTEVVVNDSKDNAEGDLKEVAPAKKRKKSQ